ncbi:DUF4062 domain-containing protein [Naasia lichenicola]|uniref:DUF4062 domain-containing protein n=1 Tax=Naasia lichenicola TaxID=2565933 RepID=A0A4V3WSS6_9MICO|nr:DUF4062 domain-containing protein [Naasia lichenicola]THG29287.1 hypothetical protein E6C64_11210 [Naasia lichenicola]
MFEADVLRVMIASPSDVAEARDAVEHAIAAWNVKHAQRRRRVLLPWRWETSSVPGLAAPAQALLDEQGVDQADMMIALMSSRLGSPTANAVSGTVEEIERARSRGIPVHLYFSSAPLPSDVDIDQLKGVREFKRQIRDQGLFAEFNDLSKLQEDVDRALTYDVDLFERQTADSYYNVDTDRFYELHETHWSFARSAVSTSVWSARHELRRRFTSRSEAGLERFTISISRETDLQVAFGGENVPSYALLPDSVRSDGEGLHLRPPHKAAGGAFAQDVVMEPPLDSGASADLHIEGEVPSFKFATRDLLEPATRNSKLGLRDWDYISLTINYPVARLIYTAFFPAYLEADVIGVRVGRGAIDAAEGARLRREGHAWIRQTVQDGVEGVELGLDVPKPHLKWTYRLCWRPPR